MTAADKTGWPFRGFCIHAPKQEDLPLFHKFITEILPARGCNTLVLITRYRFRFKSHPEVSEPGGLTHEQAAEIASLCRKAGVRFIPKMNLLGHQSSVKGAGTQGLLRAHPEFEEAPDVEHKGCRSLCPRHPDVKPILLDLVDEMIDAFEADAFHVGLDEVFEIGMCERCKGTPTAEIYADWVNALHEHIVGKRGIEMLMWGDRLINEEGTGYGEWQASRNDTWPAIDHVPKDIIICDWHYDELDDYPSVPMFLEKGFRMVVCPSADAAATKLLMDYAAAHRTDRLLGVLQTGWVDSGAIIRHLLVGRKTDTPGAKAAMAGESFKLAMRM